MNETCMNHALNMPNIGGCPYCRITELEQQLAEAYEELALSIKERIELGGKLSRYQGGVEVEGAINEYGKFTIAEATACPPELIGQRVRVLVMPMQEKNCETVDSYIRLAKNLDW